LIANIFKFFKSLFSLDQEGSYVEYVSEILSAVTRNRTFFELDQVTLIYCSFVSDEEVRELKRFVYGDKDIDDDVLTDDFPISSGGMIIIRRADWEDGQVTFLFECRDANDNFIRESFQTKEMYPSHFKTFESRIEYKKMIIPVYGRHDKLVNELKLTDEIIVSMGLK